MRFLKLVSTILALFRVYYWVRAFRWWTGTWQGYYAVGQEALGGGDKLKVIKLKVVNFLGRGFSRKGM